MIDISNNLVSDFQLFVSGAVSDLVPIIGITAGIFVAFAIFDRVVRSVIKAVKK